MANWSSRSKDVPTAWYGTSFGKSGTTAKDESRLLELRYDGDVSNGWQPSLRIYNGSYRFDGDYNYDPDPNARDRARADWTGTEAQLTYTGIAQHKVVVGVDAQWNTRVEQQYYEVDSGDMILDTNDTSRTVGLYAQDEWRFHPQWLLNASLRYDIGSHQRIALSVTNLLDKMPPRDATWSNYPYYDTSWFDSFGRSFFVQLTYKFGGKPL